MRPKPARWSDLSKLYREERLIARIAGIARNDTINGGALAMVLTKRLKAMGGTDLGHVVSDVYSGSTGKHHPYHEAWRCPECDTVCLGYGEAAEHCYDEE